MDDFINVIPILDDGLGSYGNIHVLLSIVGSRLADWTDSGSSRSRRSTRPMSLLYRRITMHIVHGTVSHVRRLLRSTS
eukprot:COSAG02_NODE_4054_length_5847_cov_4.397878_3_plen_78_part_00